MVRGAQLVPADSGATLRGPGEDEEEEEDGEAEGFRRDGRGGAGAR